MSRGGRSSNGPLTRCSRCAIRRNRKIRRCAVVGDAGGDPDRGAVGGSGGDRGGPDRGFVVGAVAGECVDHAGARRRRRCGGRRSGVPRRRCRRSCGARCCCATRGVGCRAVGDVGVSRSIICMPRSWGGDRRDLQPRRGVPGTPPTPRPARAARPRRQPQPPRRPRARHRDSRTSAGPDVIASGGATPEHNGVAVRDEPAGSMRRARSRYSTPMARSLPSASKCSATA